MLSILSPAEIAECNQRRANHTLVHRDGTPAPTAVIFALGTPSREQIYRVEDSIAWLLPDLALVDTAAARTALLTAERKVVQSFYDEYGWAKSEKGQFNDTAQFTDTSMIARDYQRCCNARIGRELPGGEYLLDVASGAIPHTEYLEFSHGYKIRICVDFSIRALREARAKLGEAGIYLLGDITRLPLASDVVDTVISLHTIYHVPKAEQTNAIDELVRVTKPAGRILIVYTWATSVAMDTAFELRSWLGRIRRALSRRGQSAAGATSTTSTVPPLYFSPQDHAWYAREIASRHRTRLKVWSAVSMTFQTRFFSADLSGRMFLAAVKAMEDCFPGLCGRFGQYPMFVISKL